jgi:glycogen debranching enzyme
MGAAKESKSRSSELDMNDLGRINSLRFNILTTIINEEYDVAIQRLKDFLQQDSDYPNFKIRVERYVQHSIDLIFAIKTKRDFPGFNSLTRSKQQELKEKVKEHFQELKVVLKKIEKSMEELRLNDIRSTHIVVQSFWLSLAAVFISGILLDIFQDIGSNAYVVFDEKSVQLLDYLFKFFN